MAECNITFHIDARVILKDVIRKVVREAVAKAVADAAGRQRQTIKPIVKIPPLGICNTSDGRKLTQCPWD